MQWKGLIGFVCQQSESTTHVKVTWEGHPEAAMTPGRVFCLRVRVNECSALPPLCLPCELPVWGTEGERRYREAVLFIHALTDSCLHAGRRWDRGGGGGERGGRRGCPGSNDDVFLLWLRPSRDRGVWWNVQDAGLGRKLTRCGEEEDWPCWAKGWGDKAAMYSRGFS